MTHQLNRLKTVLADRYTVERELGRGGMATVYLAEDLKHERKVAIKVLRPELAASVGAERFLREIKIAANLSHPHILPVHDSGSVADRQDSSGEEFLYYVMPYVEGDSLRDKLIRERQLPIEDALRITSEVAAALSYAHEQGVIHRDIKPENIMLSAGGALVADFGIARAVSVAGGEQLTETGMAVGTPAYMSPEQACGESSLDGRSDIYSLGSVLYEMLGGDPPFPGTTPQAIIARKVAEPAPRLKPLRDTLTEPLEQAVLKSLARSPADRYATGEQFVAALSAAQQGISVPTVAVERKKPRAALALATVGAAAVVVAVVAVVLLRSDGSAGGEALDPDRVVVAPFRNETGDSTLDLVGRMAGDWITHGIQQTGIVEALPWETAQRLWRFVQTEADSGRVLDPVVAMAEGARAGVVVSGAYYLEGDDIRIQASVTDAARQTLLGPLQPLRGPRDSISELVGELQQRVMGLLAVRVEGRLAVLGDLAGDPPRFDAYQAFNEGLTNWGRSGQQWRRAIELDPTYAEAYLSLAILLVNLDRYSEADSVLNVMSGLGERLTPYYKAYMEGTQAIVHDDLETALVNVRAAAEMAPGSRAWRSYGVLCVWTNRPREAVRVYSTFDVDRVAAGDDTNYVFWAAALHLLGEHERELEVGLRLGEFYPDRVPRALQIQMDALAALGRIEDLKGVLDELASLDAPQVMATALVESSESLRVGGYAEAAADILARAIDWFEARPLDERASSWYREWYARLLFHAERQDEAQQVFDSLVEEFPEIGWYRGWRGFVAATRGDTAQAIADEQWLADLNRPHQRGVLTRLRGSIAGALGRREEAVMLFRLASEQGMHFFFDMEYNPLFDALRGYAPFEEWLRPKG